MNAFGWGIVQFLVVAGIAPLLQGLIKKTKALLQGRLGPGVLQPYRDLGKWMRKNPVVSEDASWIFRYAPFAAWSAAMTAALLLPVAVRQSPFGFAGDLVLIVYLLALMRILLALAGMDTGSSFGAQSASRELFVSLLAEPALFMVLAVAAIPLRTTNLSAIADRLSGGFPISAPAYFMMAAAFAILLLTETGRLPVDNPDTHLELTMIHEGTLLEYSGPMLGMLHWASWVKQTVLLTLFIDLVLPWGIGTSASAWSAAAGLAAYLLKLAVLGAALAAAELSAAKMRLFQVPKLLAVALLLALFAALTQSLI